MQLELAELDQVFTAKSIDRGVQDTCSTGSTGRISGIGITGTSTGTGTGTKMYIPRLLDVTVLGH